MKKLLSLTILVFLVTVALLLVLLKKKNPPFSIDTHSLSPSPTISSKFQRYQASFTIYTNGTKRIFTDPKYHNTSEQVYITAEDPSRLTVTQSQTSWKDFFNSLPSPMKVENNCLTTGTGQVFCSNTSSSLKFFLNGKRDNNVLDKMIQPYDHLVISYGPLDDSNVSEQIKN